jgi:hypothetical protein
MKNEREEKKIPFLLSSDEKKAKEKLSKEKNSSFLLSWGNLGMCV